MKKLFFVLLMAWVPLAFSTVDDNLVQEMVDGASHFLSGLQEYQREVATFEFDNEERFDWHYIPRERKGLPFETMSPDQRKLAHRLFRYVNRPADRALCEEPASPTPRRKLGPEHCRVEGSSGSIDPPELPAFHERRYQK